MSPKKLSFHENVHLPKPNEWRKDVESSLRKELEVAKDYLSLSVLNEVNQLECSSKQSLENIKREHDEILAQKQTEFDQFIEQLKSEHQSHMERELVKLEFELTVKLKDKEKTIVSDTLT